MTDVTENQQQETPSTETELFFYELTQTFGINLSRANGNGVEGLCVWGRAAQAQGVNDFVTMMVMEYGMREPGTSKPSDNFELFMKAMIHEFKIELVKDEDGTLNIFIPRDQAERFYLKLTAVNLPEPVQPPAVNDEVIEQ